ncbi:hypothetical protein CHS0354_035605 [Potamilus streckersoni]|uniref:Uncharacterized protein n=1 Tax=Potamilus streckersoni TaxID=2493646 RepID=A0AAE0RRR5_9BIVA|nr:hypothetical protein CHS0354_035605 [Potamilus streckersoni]
MKTSLVVIAALIVVIQAENCYEVADCNHIKCGPGTSMRCITPIDLDSGLCTCVATITTSCTVQAECQRDICSLRDPHEHCVDGHCACLHFQP